MANNIKIIRRAFNAGEISKSAKWRNDTEKHAYACERLENFYVDVLGGIKRRKGTFLLSKLGVSDDNVRLIPFEFNRELSYVLAFSTRKELNVAPNWKGQTSKYGSYIKDGTLYCSYETARQVKMAEVNAKYESYCKNEWTTCEKDKAEFVKKTDELASLNAEAEALGQKPDKSKEEQDRYDELWETIIPEVNNIVNEITESLIYHYLRAYNFANWEDFRSYNAGEYDNIDRLLYIMASNDYVYPINNIEEEITVPFDVIGEAVVSYRSEGSGVSVYIGDELLENGDKDISGCECVKFKFTISKGSSVKWEGSITYESGIGKDEVKLEVFSISGKKVYTSTRTPIPASALNDFQYKQVGGYIYIAHPEIVPQRLSYEGDVFKWSNAVYINPSLSNKESVVLSSGNISGIAYAGETIVLSADTAFFDSSMVGKQLKIDYTDSAKATYEWSYYDDKEKITEEFASCGKILVEVQGGVWDGILILEESTDNGKTWAEVGRTTSIQGSDNTSFEREFYDVNSVVRCRMLEQNEVKDTSSTVVASETEGCRFNIIRKTSASVWVEVVAVNNAWSATVNLLSPTRRYIVSAGVYQSVWSDNLGYPRAVEIHEERLTLAGTASKPATIWLSEANKWDNFRSISVLDTDPLEYTLASDDGEPISWLVSRSDLMIGMGTSEWSLGSRDSNQALTASIVHASCQSDDGVEYIMPTKAGGMVVFVRRGNREIASFAYDYVNDSYNAMSLTTMNPDLLASGVKCLFNQLSPRNNIYAVLNNGEVAVFTYDKENNVCAWSRFIFGGGVISACALSTGAYRSVFLAVKRDGHITLERLDANEAETDNWLDCVPIKESLDTKGLNVCVPYRSVVRTTPVFVDGNIRIVNVGLYMLNSFGGKLRVVGYDQNGDETADEWRRILPRESEFLASEKKPRDYRFVQGIDAGYLQEGSVEVATDDKAPFELTAIGLNAKG